MVAIRVPLLKGFIGLTGASSFLFFAGSEYRAKFSATGKGIALR